MIHQTHTPPLRRRPAALLACLALLVGGCSQPETDTGATGEPMPVSFTTPGAIATGAITRTTGSGDAWLPTDRVGIYMLSAGGNLTVPQDVLAANCEYSVDPSATGILSPAGTGTPMYYPQSGQVDFIAYYPYTASATQTCSISLAGQHTGEAAQNAADVLYSQATGIQKSQTPVALTFAHVLSKATFNIILGEGLTTLQGSDITAATLAGMPQSATMDLQDGTLAPGFTENFSALKALTPAIGAAATFTALLIPQAVNAYTNRKAVFTIDGQEYTWSIPGSEAFEAGRHYTYQVTVNRKGISVGVSTISPWVPSTTHAPGGAEAVMAI